jgi:hypothetical protein
VTGGFGFSGENGPELHRFEGEEIIHPHPGSKKFQENRAAILRVPVPLEVVADPLRDHEPMWRKVGNESVPFWGIGVLAKLLKRKAGTIRKWENDKVIPPAQFQTSNDSQDPRSRRRLYTRAQIIGIWTLAREEGLLDSACHISSTDFTERVFEGWPFDDH